MTQKWYSVDECLPFLRTSYPEYYPTGDKRAHSYWEFIVRGKCVDDDETYWIYSVARLMRTWNTITNDGWILKWDCHNEDFWYGQTEITDWMDLGDSLISTNLDDNCEEE